MSDLDTVLRGTLVRFHSNSCYPQALAGELDAYAKQVSALFAAEIARIKDANLLLSNSNIDLAREVDTLREQLVTIRRETIEGCAKIADDYTPSKHDGTLAAHVTGRSISREIRTLLTDEKGAS